MEFLIQLSKYGFNMGSRLLGRDVIDDVWASLPNDCGVVNVKIDFSGIRYMSLSFATELFYALYDNNNVSDVDPINALPTIQNQIRYIDRHYNDKIIANNMHVGCNI